MNAALARATRRGIYRIFLVFRYCLFPSWVLWGLIVFSSLGSALRVVWRYFKLAFGALLVFVTVSGLVLPESDYVKRYANLEYEGRLTDAVVTKKTISETASPTTPTTPLYALGPVGGLVGGFIDGQRVARATSGRPNPTDKYYYIEYQFRTTDKELVKHKKKIDLGQYRAIKVGAKLNTIYHPLSPRIHRLTSLSDPYQPIPFSAKLMSALLFGGLGVFLVWRNWRPRRTATAGMNAESRLGRDPQTQHAAELGQSPVMPSRARTGGFARPRGVARRSSFGQRA